MWLHSGLRAFAPVQPALVVAVGVVVGPRRRGGREGVGEGEAWGFFGGVGGVGRGAGAGTATADQADLERGAAPGVDRRRDGKDGTGRRGRFQEAPPRGAR